MSEFVQNRPSRIAVPRASAGRGVFSVRGLFIPTILLTALAVSGCASRAPTDLVLKGVPARTNLHQATGLPPEAVRTVVRRDGGWTMIYRPALAPPDADVQAARALCQLERKAMTSVLPAPLEMPFDDPGSAAITVRCG